MGVTAGSSFTAILPELITGGQVAASTFGAGTQILAGRYNAELAERNADLAEQRAKDATRRGREAEQRHRVDVRRLIGAQRAAFAAQNVELDSGSALDVQMDTAYLGELDALTIRNNAALEAWGYRVQSSNLQAEADRERFSSTTGAAGTLLTGAADAARTYYQLKR